MWSNAIENCKLVKDSSYKYIILPPLVSDLSKWFGQLSMMILVHKKINNLYSLKPTYSLQIKRIHISKGGYKVILIFNGTCWTRNLLYNFSACTYWQSWEDFNNILAHGERIYYYKLGATPASLNLLLAIWHFYG